MHRIRRCRRRFRSHFSFQQKVTEAIFQSLGTSPSEMSKRAVLTVSFGSGIAAGVAALTISGQADVNKTGAGSKRIREWDG